MGFERAVGGSIVGLLLATSMVGQFGERQGDAQTILAGSLVAASLVFLAWSARAPRTPAEPWLGPGRLSAMTAFHMGFIPLGYSIGLLVQLQLNQPVAILGFLAGVTTAVALARYKYVMDAGRPDEPAVPGRSTYAPNRRGQAVLAVLVVIGSVGFAASAAWDRAVPEAAFSGLSCLERSDVMIDYGVQYDTWTLEANTLGFVQSSPSDAGTWNLPRGIVGINWTLTWNGGPAEIFVAGTTPDGSRYIGESVTSGQTVYTHNLRNQAALQWTVETNEIHMEDTAISVVASLWGDKVCP